MAFPVPVMDVIVPRLLFDSVQVYGWTPPLAVNDVVPPVAATVTSVWFSVRTLLVGVTTRGTALEGTVATPKTGEVNAGSIQVPRMVATVPSMVMEPEMVAAAPDVLRPSMLKVAWLETATWPMDPPNTMPLSSIPSSRSPVCRKSRENSGSPEVRCTRKLPASGWV